jgi:hypothetical protein
MRALIVIPSVGSVSGLKLFGIPTAENNLYFGVLPQPLNLKLVQGLLIGVFQVRRFEVVSRTSFLRMTRSVIVRDQTPVCAQQYCNPIGVAHFTGLIPGSQ